MAIPEKPISRIEHYLARANGQNVQPPEPISRVEHYLAGIAGGVPQELLDDVADLKSQISEKAPAIMQTVSDQEIASFSDGADDMPLKSLVVAINPVQAGTGDPSPENVRPISGWTGAKVTRTGKNLLSYEATTQTIRGVTFTVNEDGTISLSGIATDNINFFLWEGARDFPNGSFTLSGCPDGGAASTYYLRIDNATGGRIAIDYGGGTGNPNFTVTDGKIYSGYIHINSGVDTNGVIFRPMLEIGSTATAYEPYQGDTYDISWESEAGTVYGGTLDVVSGELTVTMAEVDLGTMTWGYSEEYQYFGATLTGMKPGTLNLKCTSYATGSGNGQGNITDKQITTGTNVNIVLIRDADYTDAAIFKAAMNGVQLVYELATPQTYQLTPVEVKTLLGHNNIFADTGNVSVIYPADTKMYIDGQIATLQALVLENISNS